MKADKTYTISYKNGEVYNYCKGEMLEFMQLQEIPVGEIGYCFLREAEGDFF